MDEKHSRLIQKLKIELGITILSALEDPQVIEIMLNPDGTIWIEQFGKPMQRMGEMSAVNAIAVMGSIASALNTHITPDSPILEGELPLDGSRFEGLIPPVVAQPTFTIRKKASQVFSLNDYISQGVMSLDQKEALETAIREHKNMVVCGGTGSGKTTLTNAIIDDLTQCSPDERLVIIEDTYEIQCNAANAVLLHTSTNVDMLQLLRATMRLRPDRILVGEVRGAEALALLKAWNTGHPGGVATLHANSAEAALIRLEQLINESSEAASMSMKPLIGEAVDLVVNIEKRDGKRRIRDMLEVKGLDESGEYAMSFL